MIREAGSRSSEQPPERSDRSKTPLTGPVADQQCKKREGVNLLMGYKRLCVERQGDALQVRFVDARPDAAQTVELVRELHSLLDEECELIIIDFTVLEMLSGNVLSELTILNKNKKLKLRNIRPKLREVFSVTRLDQRFEIIEE